MDKKSANGRWYHKMATCGAIMKMKAGVTPASAGATDEHYTGDQVFHPANYSISGDIYYFAFTT
ncbi:MAG: hypothetical protein IKQ54_05720, partial [Oscillospiraceae bacterium]|nr:hypothetical protein [Oscillospiraceae bacterium]